MKNLREENDQLKRDKDQLKKQNIYLDDKYEELAINAKKKINELA